ncbi:cell surface protein [Lactobacillus ruminis]|uniref:3D domain-containing protein n=1 Tax=Ligilactobacillus ruminis TaxID=1623 RepID=UPI00101F0417|nr:3D domain-containing protein [Ligilactobacillus ruminis]MSB44148.1 cell surface protein [Ligilactobacillus ruminis]MSB54447.1 cell surface protein [Ligilactobacillus ruminis]MSB56482.1 cell surface protein [Ligilactobacillus ruminis]MSB81540.1 cell surface protein [Ligilactobacillus ruminis]MSB90789.1 cell surface protein [Ligilactobacillus ruminis]
MKIKKAVLLVLISILFNLRAAAVAGLCDSVADIQAKQESVKKQLDQNSNELSGKMDEINQVYQKLSDLEGKKKETEQRITQTQTKLQQAQQEKKNRVRDAKERLCELQKRQGTNTSLSIIEKSTSLTQWLRSMIALQRLQSVYNDSLAAVKQSIVDISQAKEQLQGYQSNLASQERQVNDQKAVLDSQMSDLKKKIADGQSEMKQLADREQQAKAMEEAQKKAAEEEAQKQQQASNQKQQVQQTSTKTVDNSEAATSADNVSGSKTLTMSATAYSTEANGMGTYSATGINLKQHPSCVAVDPSVIPLGSIIWVSGYGVSVAGDTGTAIKGNIIDLHFATVAQSMAWGRRTVTVKILN